MGFEALDPLLHSQLRLAVMSILVTAGSAEFTDIKEKTGATAGNLSVQLDKLEKASYIEIIKGFRGKRPVTTAKITDTGKQAFGNYVKALRDYLP